MRRSLLAASGAIGAGVLVAALVPVAAAKPIPVDGDRFSRAGLTALNQACFDRRSTSPVPPTLKIRRGPGDVPIGQHSEGWQTTGAGFGAGWVAHVKTPASVSRLRIQLFSPSQEADGHAVVYYHPDGDSGYWFGNHSMGADTKKGWHSVNAATASFTWTHYTADDVDDRSAPYAPIAEHVKNYGGNDAGAELGFVFGCDQNAFFVDKLELRTAHDHRTFDFGGFRTQGKLTIGETSPEKAVLLYGYELKISGALVDRATNDRLSGVLTFQGKRASGGSWQRVGKDKTTPQGRASTVVQPRRTTVYRTTYAGVDRYEASRSNTIKIVIRNKVSAHLVDSTVTKGQTFTVAGTVKPGKKTGILLQRYLNGSWRTVKKGSTAGDGDFRISAVARDAGGSYWRIRSRPGGGTVGNVSKNMKLDVKQPASSPNPPPSDDPEPPPPPPPPPPPEG
jgi:hypothetical protein